MAIDYAKWDKTYNVNKDEVKKLDENAGKKDYVEVPFGQYEVSIASMELASSKKGDPMVKVRFRVLEGKYKGNSIFMNQVIIQDFQVHNCNEFLRSLDSGIPIEWTGSYGDYADLIDDVFKAVDKTLEYALDYRSDNKGYSVFEVAEVFEKE